MPDTQQNTASTATNDRYGKPFLVMAANLRKCIVCNELFTRQQAAGHSRVACYPQELQTRGEY